MLHGRTDGRTVDGWIDGWTNEPTEGWMDGLMGDDDDRTHHLHHHFLFHPMAGFEPQSFRFASSFFPSLHYIALH